jgi:hypothetical protein
VTFAKNRVLYHSLNIRRCLRIVSRQFAGRTKLGGNFNAGLGSTEVIFREGQVSRCNYPLTPTNC